MFSADPQKPREETPDERDRRRAREGRDRRGLKQVVIALTLLFSGMTLLVAADVAFVERRLTTATVVALVDRGHQCVTQLTTGYGYARIYTRNFCQYAPWRIGDTAEVEARQMRLTGTVVLTTHGTIFEGAYTALPPT